MDIRILMIAMTLTVMANGVCYFGPNSNCYYPCRCSDAPEGEYTGGRCNRQTGVCTSGSCMDRPYNESGRTQNWKSKKQGCIQGLNLAEGKPAIQSNGSPEEAAKALDYYDKVCTSINSGMQHVGAWWRVDLGSTHFVDSVYVKGIDDEADFENITVWFSQGLTQTGYNYRECGQTSSSNSYNLNKCESDNIRHLMVQKAGGKVRSHFSICEVVVTGRKHYDIGTNCSRCIDNSNCNIWGFCNNCNASFYGPKCEGLKTINGSFTITGKSFNTTLTNNASLLYQELKLKVSTWLGSTCPDEGNGCYNKLTDVTFSPGSIQADYTMEVLESQTDHSVLLTIYAMIANGTFTGNDTTYVINGTSVTAGSISAATLFKRTNGSVRVTTDKYYGNDATTWQGLNSAWFDNYCRTDRMIPTIFCDTVTTTLKYNEENIFLNFEIKLSTSIDDELFFKTWRDAIHNDGFANISYKFDHLSFGNYSDHCESSPCQFGGTCLYGVNSYSCLCLPGVTGLSCETNMNECDSAPCMLNHACVDEVNGYNCVCAPGYTGLQCDTDVNECTSSPCALNRMCLDEVDGYKCVCSPGYTGPQCEQVKLMASYPTYGPIAGGTNVTLTGTFTDIAQLNFTLEIQDSTPALNDSLVCSTVSWNRTHALMTTPEVDDSYGDVKYNIVMTYTDEHGINYTIESGMMFTYKPNPAIAEIHPNKAFISGGIKITATGTNFDSVSDPVLTITVEQRMYKNENDYIVENNSIYISENTTVINSTSIVATTPKIPESTLSEPQNKAYQHQLNVAYIGFILDGVGKYQNLSKELGDKGMVKLIAKPHVQDFGEDTLMYDPKTVTHIEIKGENFKLGATINDFTVTIGDGVCEVQDLYDNAMYCKPPTSEPNAVEGKNYKEGQPHVMMKIGDAKFNIGYIDYIEGVTSALLYTLLSVVLIVVIAIIVSVFFCKRNRSNSNQPNDSPREEAHFKMSTNKTSDNLTSVSSSNMYSSNLRPSSSQEATLQPQAEAEQRLLDTDDQLEASRFKDGYLKPISSNQPEDSRFRDGYLEPINHSNTQQLSTHF